MTTFPTPPMLPRKAVDALPVEAVVHKKSDFVPPIVGTRSHPFIMGPEQRSAPYRCRGVLGNREGKVCNLFRCDPIHDDYLNFCVVCTVEIRTMAFRGTGVCSELHRKQRDGEKLKPFRAVAP